MIHLLKEGAISKFKETERWRGTVRRAGREPNQRVDSALGKEGMEQRQRST